MAYAIHITIADGWWESEQKPILLEKIIALAPNGENEVSGKNTDTGEVITISTEYSFEWAVAVGEPKYAFHYTRGRITFNYVSDAQIAVAKALAAKLGAIVQGDEEELY
ncbi:hypothetical protein N480_00825 [Pseudoalteromonas luteoviolacea S2607]|uniref:hypothetical protein n=1 Tax=Pseudoalteromonas luteoviolacea TaxID=43657 RepID=UPI0007B072F6|nr:hypothetical protein [Pseudoalteromonas luteoviolacea]KZN39406.1 hypothetical protein N480_00825 [Pseudoalteromonas luteoviolacea S2607]